MLMGSRLLVSVAALVASVTLASAQSPPGGAGRQRNQARDHDIGRLPISQGPAQSPLAGKAMTQTTVIGRQIRDRSSSPMPPERRLQVHLQSQATRRPDQGTGRPDRRALQIQSHKAPVRTAAPPPYARQDSGSHGGQAEVRAAQAALNQHGFNVGNPDGKLGRRTKEALIVFQRQHGFQPTGRVDRTTLHALSAGAAPDGQSQDNKDNGGSPKPAPAQAIPQNHATEPATTGQGHATPAPGTASPQREEETPDNAASRRVPAAAPQQNYSDDTPPAADDQR
jgi:peptidoglycan hydrolase-like protein with peptidoglycan-binding domain